MPVPGTGQIGRRIDQGAGAFLVQDVAVVGRQPGDLMRLGRDGQRAGPFEFGVHPVAVDTRLDAIKIFPTEALELVDLGGATGSIRSPDRGSGSPRKKPPLRPDAAQPDGVGLE